MQLEAAVTLPLHYRYRHTVQLEAAEQLRDLQLSSGALRALSLAGCQQLASVSLACAALRSLDLSSCVAPPPVTRVRRECNGRVTVV